MPALTSRTNNAGTVNFDALQTVDGDLTFEAGAVIDLNSPFFANAGRYAVYRYGNISGTLIGFSSITTANVLVPVGRTCTAIVNEPTGKYIIATLE